MNLEKITAPFKKSPIAIVNNSKYWEIDGCAKINLSLNAFAEGIEIDINIASNCVAATCASCAASPNSRFASSNCCIFDAPDALIDAVSAFLNACCTFSVNCVNSSNTNSVANSCNKVIPSFNS